MLILERLHGFAEIVAVCLEVESDGFAIRFAFLSRQFRQRALRAGFSLPWFQDSRFFFLL